MNVNTGTVKFTHFTLGLISKNSNISSPEETLQLLAWVNAAVTGMTVNFYPTTEASIVITHLSRSLKTVCCSWCGCHVQLGRCDRSVAHNYPITVTGHSWPGSAGAEITKPFPSRPFLILTRPFITRTITTEHTVS